jgi:hypothetical protein
MIVIVGGIGIIKIAEIGSAIIEIRRRRTIVVAGAPTASAACRRSPSRKMIFLGLRLQSERVTVLACLPSVWIRTKIASLLVSLLSLSCSSISVLSCLPKSLMCLCCVVGLYDSYFTVVSSNCYFRLCVPESGVCHSFARPD